MLNDWKAQHVIGLSLSDEPVENVNDLSSLRKMRNTVSRIFERYTLLSKLGAQQRLYTFAMGVGRRSHRI